MTEYFTVAGVFLFAIEDRNQISKHHPGQRGAAKSPAEISLPTEWHKLC